MAKERKTETRTKKRSKKKLELGPAYRYPETYWMG